MTPLTRCDLSLQSKKLLHPVVLLKVLFLLLVLGALALAQTHLRFRTRDLQIETRKLQKQGAELKNRMVSLVAKTERLKIYSPEFREYARTRLGLQECPPERSSKLAVPDETVSRWRRLGDRFDRPSAAPPSRVRMMAELGQRVMSWSTTTMAQEPLGDEE